MSTIDPSLLESIFSVTYSYAPDPGTTVSYTRARININNIHSINCDTLTYSNIDFGDASGNLFVGDRAGCNSSLVSNCTGIGEQSMDFLAKGSNVTSVGFSSLRNTASLTRVVAIGTFAGDSNSNVADTVLIGDSVARNLSGASSNVIIGSGAGASLTGGSNNILIGAGVNPVSGSNNNVINIGNTISGTIGGTISMPSVYANGVYVLGGGGNPGFVVQDASANQQFRLQWLPAPNARSIIQTNAPLYFNQVGTAQGNTYLNISTASTDGDFFHVGGDFESRTLRAYSTTSASTYVALTTSYGSTRQQVAHALVDTNSTGYGVERQYLTYVYPATGTTSRPLGGGGELKASTLLLSDQSGLSAGDVIFYNSVSLVTLFGTNLSIGGTISASNIMVGGTISATTVSATNIYGNIILGVQTV